MHRSLVINLYILYNYKYRTRALQQKYIIKYVATEIYNKMKENQVFDLQFEFQTLIRVMKFDKKKKTTKVTRTKNI